MSPLPQAFLTHLRTEGYHPRSNKHSNALAEALVADLVRTCPPMQEKAAKGELVYDLNFTILSGTSDWNIDLVLGNPPPDPVAPEPAQSIVRARPSTVQLALEIKSVMTEHRKAIRNRKRDFEAHHEHVHRYSNQAIAAGVLVINQAGSFRSPLRPAITEHKLPLGLTEHCIRQMRGVSGRQGMQGTGLEAKAVIVLDMDNVDLPRTRLVTKAPAPQVGDPLHYDAFVQALCAIYAERFA